MYHVDEPSISASRTCALGKLRAGKMFLRGCARTAAAERIPRLAHTTRGIYRGPVRSRRIKIDERLVRHESVVLCSDSFFFYLDRDEISELKNRLDISFI